MKALNRAFEKAFAHTGVENDLADLLACMGEELGCDRISIFEEDEEECCDNTYEWCRPGVMREQVLLQHIAVDKFDTWKDRLHEQETIIVRNPEELIRHDPDVYYFFKEQDIKTAMVTLLAFHGKSFGFCILENPAKEVMEDWELVMPGIRYILSSMIYSRNLVQRLRRLGYVDTLTGAGNRVSLQEYLETLDYGQSVSVICLDVVGWDNAKGKIAHLEKEQTLVRTGDILISLFDNEHVFRVSTGEFLVVENGWEKAAFESQLHTLRGLLRENNLLASVSGIREERLKENIDHLIHALHRKVEDEKRVMLEHRRAGELQYKTEKEIADEEKAHIDLPRGDAFFGQADRFLSELFEESVIAAVIDINYFNLYNDIFGRKAGNIFLENISEVIQKMVEEHGGICGYLGGDNFCFLVPTDNKDHRVSMKRIEEIYKSVNFPDGFAPVMGVYFSDDRRETSIIMYDRALSALSDIKGNYIRYINYYSAETHHHQKEDRILLMNVKEGLAAGEFLFYVQPQVNEKSGKIIGGEALVRWMHQGKLLSPGEFIPVLEKTGYIYAVDTYLWESVAAWQRNLLDRGIKALPISVNVSRVDFYFIDIAETFIGLIKKYNLHPDLIGIEITESAFTDNTDTIKSAVKKLHEAGFHILMDDFGSGSSSLSMLHSMQFDVLKTDVQFMSRDTKNNRAISIVESVISMAHLIGMSVITEGVETEEQKASLIALGENYAQGFYFYKPMPKESFEELISDPENVTDGYWKSSVSHASELKFREMIKEGLVSETLLQRILRASAIYKEENGQITIVQMNDMFSDITGIRPDSEEMNRFVEYLGPEDLEILQELFLQANTHPLGGSEGMIRFRKADGQTVEMNMRIFLLYTFDEHRLYLSTMG